MNRVFENRIATENKSALYFKKRLLDISLKNGKCEKIQEFEPNEEIPLPKLLK